MIGTYISGRMGNQFFRYAYTRAIQENRGNKDKLIFNFNMVYKKNQKDSSFEDVLKYFKVQPYLTDTNDLIWKYGNLSQKISYIKYLFNIKILSRINRNIRNNKKKFHTSLRKRGLMFASEDESGSTFQIPESENIFINGNYENRKYFDAIRDILIHELQPKEPLKKENEELYKTICNSNSVCITIRRGDYLSDKNRKSFFLCDDTYFRKGINIIKEKIKDPTFIFFSDDISYVKENFKLDNPCFYESGNDPIWEKIRLMSSCKHFIISNSTFSWWAQYLSLNPDKVVVSPSRWYNANLESMLIEKSFIKIEV